MEPLVKCISSVVYQHCLMAPKGRLFDVKKLKESNVFNAESIASMSFELTHTPNTCRVIKWSELYINTVNDIPNEQWTEWLEPVLVDELAPVFVPLLQEEPKTWAEADLLTQHQKG